MSAKTQIQNAASNFSSTMVLSINKSSIDTETKQLLKKMVSEISKLAKTIADEAD